VRIRHKPTGITVTCQDERSQIQNREKAMRLLRSRLYEKQRQQQEAEQSAVRKSSFGTGDRSEKIRTYNFPQNRVTDHRINYTSHNLSEILDGDLDDLVNSLIEHEQAALLATQPT
ncbi:MAG: peptide chain release factor 1, partial [Fimbriimonadales bacterium]|nr:peptide chain release factor 1 [Fimbriimonadales bacterium]